MDNLLLEIGGKELYLDIERLSEIVRIDSEPPPLTVNGGKDNVEVQQPIPDMGGVHIDVTKYEMYREMIGGIMMYNEEVDNKMGIVALNSATIPFKVAFNTLLMKGILKEL
jgi:hypothetical protein